MLVRLPPHPASEAAALAPSRQKSAAVSDEVLLARLAEDDAGALELILSRHWPLVVGYLSRMTGAVDAAEDLAQRTFCRLWARRAAWRPDGSLRALLCRVARNLAVSEHRRRASRERSEAAFLELSAPGETAADHAARYELRVALERAIDRLPERRREIVVLRCVHGLSYREISDVMGIAEQTVANQLSRALRTLRTTLGDALG